MSNITPTNTVFHLPYNIPLVDKNTGNLSQTWLKIFSNQIVPALQAKSSGNTTTTVDWGNIQGSINNQTDLFNALTGKQNSLGFTPINKAGDTSIGPLTGISFNKITGISAVAPLMNGAASIGLSTDVSAGDHIHPTDTTRAPLYDFLLTNDPVYTNINYTNTYNGSIVTNEYWKNGTTLVKEIDYTYTASLLTTEIRKIYASDGITIVAQLTIAYTYNGDLLTSATYTRNI